MMKYHGILQTTSPVNDINSKHVVNPDILKRTRRKMFLTAEGTAAFGRGDYRKEHGSDARAPQDCFVA